MTVQYLLEVMEWDKKSADLFIGQYATIRRIKLPGKVTFAESLKTIGLSAGEIEEAKVLKQWLTERAKEDPTTLNDITSDFNQREWEATCERYVDEEEASLASGTTTIAPPVQTVVHSVGCKCVMRGKIISGLKCHGPWYRFSVSSDYVLGHD